MSALILSRGSLADLRDGYAVTLADVDGDEALTLTPEALDEDVLDELETGEQVELELDGTRYELLLAARSATVSVDDENADDEEDDDESPGGVFSAEARRGLDWDPDA